MGPPRRPLGVFLPAIVLLSIAIPVFLVLTGIDDHTANLHPSDSRSTQRGLFTVAYLASLVCQALVMGLWLQRAAYNLRAVGIPGLRWSPGMALAGWLVPYACFVIPILVIKEVWLASQSAPVPPSPRLPRWMVVWWTCWILWIPLGLVPVILDHLAGLSDRSFLLALVPAGGAFLVAWVLFLRFVFGLSRIHDRNLVKGARTTV